MCNDPGNGNEENVSRLHNHLVLSTTPNHTKIVGNSEPETSQVS
jgi:hypothetical protein